MNSELRRAIINVQNMLCNVSEALQSLPGDQFQYAIATTEDFLAGDLLRMLGCKVEFLPLDRESIERISDLIDPAEIKKALVQGKLLITLPPDMSNV